MNLSVSALSQNSGRKMGIKGLPAISMFFVFALTACSLFSQPIEDPIPSPADIPLAEIKPTQPPVSEDAPLIAPGTELKDITYCVANGVELKMDLYYPDEVETLLPVIVYVHGGGWTGGDKASGAGFRFLPVLREGGYLTISVNYRLSPKYKFPAHIEDVKCAIRHLRAEAETYNLDPNRIGAIGGSAGGHLVALLGVTDESAGMEGSGGYIEYSSRVQAVIDLFGPIDPTESCTVGWARQVFGANCEDEIISLSSPLAYVSSDDPPFLILHGDRDELVLLEQSQTFYDSLTAVGVPATLQIIKNAGHGLSSSGDPIEPNIEALLQLAVDFFDQNLK